MLLGLQQAFLRLFLSKKFLTLPLLLGTPCIKFSNFLKKFCKKVGAVVGCPNIEWVIYEAIFRKEIGCSDVYGDFSTVADRRILTFSPCNVRYTREKSSPPSLLSHFFMQNNPRDVTSMHVSLDCFSMVVLGRPRFLIPIGINACGGILFSSILRACPRYRQRLPLIVFVRSSSSALSRTTSFEIFCISGHVTTRYRIFSCRHLGGLKLYFKPNIHWAENV